MLEEEAISSVMELIHAAALCPDGWHAVLRRLAELTGCVAGGLTVERPATRQGTPLTYFGFDPDHVARSFDHYLPLNPLFKIEPLMQRGFVVANADVVAPKMFRRSEFYNGWARPQGLCSPVTVVIHRTSAAYVPLTLVRPDGAGEATADSQALLRRLAPHLAHAMDITVRLQAAGATRPDFTTVLDALPCGAVLIDQAHRIVFTNGAARELLDSAAKDVLRCASGQLALRDPAVDRQFQSLLSAALGLRAPARGGELAVQHPSDKTRLTLSLSPVPHQDGPWSALADDGSQACCLVLISMPNAAKLAQRYGLTPAEARVAAAIAGGGGVAAAARDLGIAPSTVNSHLDKVFQKTGTNRQAELAGLVRAGLGA